MEQSGGQVMDQSGGQERVSVILMVKFRDEWEKKEFRVYFREFK